MALTPMTPGGRWVAPPFESEPVYVPPKQLEAHLKRLISDGWMPMSDPRREDTSVPVQEPTPTLAEVALRTEIDQLKAMMAQLLAQKSEQHDGSTQHDVSVDSENAADDRRSGKRKPAV